MMTVQNCTPQWHVYEGAPTFDQPCRCGAETFTGWGGATEPVVTPWKCAGCGRKLTDFSPHAFDSDGRPYCPGCNERDLSELLEGREYAVEREDGWHIATWDGECFDVTSNWQSGDRWLPEWVTQYVLLPPSR